MTKYITAPACKANYQQICILKIHLLKVYLFSYKNNMLIGSFETLRESRRCCVRKSRSSALDVDFVPTSANVVWRSVPKESAAVLSARMTRVAVPGVLEAPKVIRRLRPAPPSDRAPSCVTDRHPLPRQLRPRQT